MIIAGIGCRREAKAIWVRAAIDAALRRSGRKPGEIAMLATLPRRARERVLLEVAACLGLPLVAVPEASLLSAAPRCLTNSPRARAATGLPSVAEAAALAAAGPYATLLAPRAAVEGATCALAEAPARAGR